MKTKHNYGSPTFEVEELKDRIFDSIREWITYYDSDVEFLGISIESKDGEIVICTEEENPEGALWFSLEPLITDGEPDDEIIFEIAEKVYYSR